MGVVNVSDQEFERLVGEAISAIKPKYLKRLENVAFLTTDEPSLAQRRELKLRPNETLFGLYQGVPLPERGGQEKLLPDKITLFKRPLAEASGSLEELRERIRHTLWHEVAHYFGLDHQEIHRREPRPPAGL